MKTLTERTQIAKAINFGKYQVLTIDLANEIKLGGEVVGYEGCKVRIKYTTRLGDTLLVPCTIKYFNDEKKVIISKNPTMLVEGLGYSDLMEMVAYANAPILDINQDVVLVVNNSNIRKALAPMIITTGNRIDINCSQPLTFVDGKMDINIF